MQGIPVTDPQTIAQSSAAASAAQSASPAAARLLTVRAILLGERIDTTGLERSDAISTVPFAFRVGDRGMVALFRYRSEEHTSELQSLMRISYAVFRLKNKKHITTHQLSPTLSI